MFLRICGRSYTAKCDRGCGTPQPFESIYQRADQPRHVELVLHHHEAVVRQRGPVVRKRLGGKQVVLRQRKRSRSQRCPRVRAQRVDHVEFVPVPPDVCPGVLSGHLHPRVVVDVPREVSQHPVEHQLVDVTVDLDGVNLGRPRLQRLHDVAAAARPPTKETYTSQTARSGCSHRCRTESADQPADPSFPSKANTGELATLSMFNPWYSGLNSYSLILETASQCL